MKTQCQKCGYPNELGHIFCMKCGVRLDLTKVDDAIEEGVGKGEKILAFLKLLWIPVAAVVVVVLVFALWPSRAFVPPKDSQPGRRERFETGVNTLDRMVKAGITDTNTIVTFAENDVNFWLEETAKTSMVSSLTVKFAPGKCTFRTVRSKGPLKVLEGKVTLPELRLSYDVVLGQGSNSVKVVSAKIGHLPLPGPLKKPLLKQASKPFVSMNKECGVFGKITRLTVGEGKLEVSVGTGQQ